MIRSDLHIDRAALAAFCQRRRIRRLSLFGSALRADFRPDSDVDLLVEFAPAAGVGYIRMGEIERELSALLGRNAELHTAEDISPHFRDQVLAEAQPLYDATR